MNFLWTFLIISSIILFLFKDPSIILSTATNSIYDSLTLCVTLATIYIFWLGIINVIQDSGLSNKISKLLSPIIKSVFKGVDKKANEYIAINLSANLLGVGNASLPAGIKAMELLKKDKKNTINMIMLFCLNCCSLQLLPSTVILLRSGAGSLRSGDIILPILIVSFVCCILTIMLVKTLFKEKNN